MIYGMEAPALPDGAVPLEAFALVKTLIDGRPQWSIRYTAGLEAIEAATLLRVEVAKIEKWVESLFEPREGES